LEDKITTWMLSVKYTVAPKLREDDMTQKLVHHFIIISEQ